MRDFLEDRRTRFIADMEGNRALYNAHASEVAFDLVMNPKSENIHARVADFLTSGAQVSSVAVHIEAHSV